MPFSTRRSSTRGTPRGLLGRSGAITRHSKSVRSYRLMHMLNQISHFDRNWMQRLGWKYVMPLVSPILPGTRSIKRSSGDLLWLLTDADAQSMSGKYVDGREIRPGSLESQDRAKIARSVEVAKWLFNERLYNKRKKQRTTSELTLPLETTAHAVAMNRSGPFG